MTEELFNQIIKVGGGPIAAIVGYLLWRCMQRSNAREDRFAEVIKDSAVALEVMSLRTDAILAQANDNRDQLVLLNNAVSRNIKSASPAD